MVPEAQRLHTALVSVFPAYTTEVFVDRGYPLDRRSVEAIERATAMLDTELAAVLDLPYDEQRRSPLEVFRTALALVAESLVEDGVMSATPADERNGSDPHGLAPGSSSALGTDAHNAHMAWGVAKAAAFTGVRSGTPAPSALIVVTPDRDEREAIIAAARERGLSCRAERNPASVVAAIEGRTILAAAVDLSHRSAREIISRLTMSGVATVVYGDGIDDLTTTGLMAQGVRTVVGRRRFLADPIRFFPTVA